MNEFYRGVILSLLTKALTGVSVWLVTNGWLSGEQTTQVVLGIAGLVASIAVTVWQRYGSALVKMAALQLPQGATLEDAKALAKTGAVAPATTPPDVAPKPVSTSATRGLMLLIAFVIGGTSLLLVPACAKSDPNMSPERKVALYGIRVNTTLKTVRETVATLYAQQVVPKPAYDKFLVGYIEVSKAGEQVAAALAAYDAATDGAGKDALVPQIDAAIVAFGTLLPNVIPEITSADGRARVTALVGEVQKLVITIMRLTAPRTSAQLRLDPGQNPECILRHCYAIAA